MIARLIVSGAVVVAICGPSSARAQSDWSIHGRLATLSGWTDNIAYAPEDDPTVAPPEADFFFDLRPGLLLTRGAPRSIHELSYEFRANLNASHSEANDYTHRAEWRGFYRASPRSSLVGSISGAIGDTRALVIETDPAVGQPDFVPPANQTFQRVEALETFRRQLSEDWRMAQEFGAARVEAFEEGETVTLSHNARLSFDIDRVWEQQALGLGAGTQFIQLESPLQFDGTSRQLNTTLEASYRRDFNEHWSGSAFVGASLLTPLEEGEAGVHPVGRLGLFYRHDVGHGGLLVMREVVPIMFAAQTAVNQSATLNVGVPLPWLAENPTEPVMFLASSAGINHSQIVGDSGDLEAGWSTFLADAGIFYTNRNPRLSIGLRYAYNQRIADEMSAVAEYTRHTIMVTLGGMYPARPSGVVPVRGGVRVDESDIDPTTDELEAEAAAEPRQ